MRYLLLTLSILCFSPLSFAQSHNLADKAQFEAFIEKYKSQTLGPELGEKFPEFEYRNLQGEVIYSDDLTDKLVVINSWFVGCTGCKQEEENLRKLTQELSGDKKIVFLSFAMSSPQRIERYFSKGGDFGYQTATVERKWIESTFLVTVSPTHFIVKDGVLVEKITLPIANEQTLDWYKNRILSFTE
ncbi:TlpA family protein disulfide reductase [Algoriphagus sp. PAP.12]|uniref:TlpA family protein disulfide reductase n=1 Tax=Algoriphagus sp. PAP.12 TaxID=2996678 RepID=UPI00227A31D0|nr:redoxin domain-containing protein [Algoriphagus sp. PAP.12]